MTEKTATNTSLKINADCLQIVLEFLTLSDVPQKCIHISTTHNPVRLRLVNRAFRKASDDAQLYQWRDHGEKIEIGWERYYSPLSLWMGGYVPCILTTDLRYLCMLRHRYGPPIKTLVIHVQTEYRMLRNLKGDWCTNKVVKKAIGILLRIGFFEDLALREWHGSTEEGQLYSGTFRLARTEEDRKELISQRWTTLQLCRLVEAPSDEPAW